MNQQLLERTAGIVGDRQLVCVQTLDLARLTSHPVVLVPGTFIAVTGKGPKGDSNESGKTSFLAAVSLLLGDPEWKLSGAGSGAASALLFEPDTAGVSAQRYASPTHGYVVGVFCDSTDPMATALTVWCQINATAPHLKVRVSDGVRLAEGPSDRERHDAADATWRSLPSSSELGARGYVEALFGDAPRCLAYVDRRGRLRSGPSLLKMNAGQFTTEQIGRSLIRLTGRALMFDNEAEQRRQLADAEDRLSQRIADDERHRVDEDADLHSVEQRNAARRHLEGAEDAWRRHFARGYLDRLSLEQRLRDELAEAEEELSTSEQHLTELLAQLEALRADTNVAERAESAELAHRAARQRVEEAKQRETELQLTADRLRERVEELRAEVAGWSGVNPAEAEHTAADARRSLEAALGSDAVAREALRRAEDELDAVARGGGGRATESLRLLGEAGIDATALLDATVVDDHARPQWEPRLSLYTDAVVVDAERLDPALSAVATMPGAVVIAGRAVAEPPPEGVQSADATAVAFLRALAQREAFTPDPQRAVDSELGVHVIGGFEPPISGRRARVEGARAAVEEAQRARAALEELVARARATLAEAERQLRHAHAAAQLSVASKDLEAAERSAADASAAVDPLMAAEKDAHGALVDLQARLQNHEARIKEIDSRIDVARATHERAEERVQSAEYRLSGLNLSYWRSGWGGDEGAARNLLAEDRRSDATLRKNASDALNDALNSLEIDREGNNSPNRDIATAARRRRQLEESGEDGRAIASLDEVALPLRDWLDAQQENDVVTADRIERNRARRSEELGYLGDECEHLRVGLTQIQDAIEQRIEQSLSEIGEQLDRLDREAGGFGAELKWMSARPKGPTDIWRWEVTPCWRRSHHGRMLPYDNQTNTAQEKLFTVHLVLAALLASPNPEGRVLVLDELGDSLGITHRRDVLQAIAQTARAKKITVLGTCQDAVLPDAAAVCGEIVYFEYPSKSHPLNRATRMFGFDEHRGRVELTADVLRTGRPLV